MKFLKVFQNGGIILDKAHCFIFSETDRSVKRFHCLDNRKVLLNQPKFGNKGQN